MPRVDLHLHSHYSDGKSDCQSLIKIAAKNKLEIVSVTDHDTLAGTEESIEAAGKFSVPYVCGVEISTNVEDMLHILGYGINTKDENLNRFLDFYLKKRFGRIEDIIKALNKHGITIKLTEVLDLVKSSPSRVHIADVLVEKKYAFGRGDAFRKFLLPQSPTYVAPRGPGVKEAISAIKNAGGFAVLAHPGVIKTSYDICQWIAYGLSGIEAFYPKHSARETRNYLDTASRYGLFVSAGSDFHGPGCGLNEQLGIEIPDKISDTLKEKLFAGG